MKKWIFFILLFCTQVYANPDLAGIWKLDSIIYRNQPMPLPNPDLELYFKFFENGESWLRWSRKNEVGFCERKADYLTFDHLLYQKTIWLNPHNASSCGNDPEMRMSSETYTDFKIYRGQLYLNLDLSDEKIVYVFKFLPEESEQAGKVIRNRVNGL